MPELLAAYLALRCELVALRFQLALIRGFRTLEAIEAKANFNPNEPRVPAGSRGGGQWTGGGGGGSGRSPNLDRHVLGDNRQSATPESKPTDASPLRPAGVTVKLPNGKAVEDTQAPTGHLMSPKADLHDVAKAGRSTGETYLRLLQNPDTPPGAAPGYLLVSLNNNLGHGGTFDYQRQSNGHGGFIQHREFRNVSNFNVGLFSQQAGLTLNETLSFSGLYASLKSSNADPGKPYGLSLRTREFIIKGYRTGESGVYGPPAALKRPR